MADRCEICGSEDDVAVCWINGERKLRCGEHGEGIIPAHDGEYGRTVPSEDCESEPEEKDEKE